jgi:hypothetical protein
VSHPRRRRSRTAAPLTSRQVRMAMGFQKSA